MTKREWTFVSCWEYRAINVIAKPGGWMRSGGYKGWFCLDHGGERSSETWKTQRVVWQSRIPDIRRFFQSVSAPVGAAGRSRRVGRQSETRGLKKRGRIKRVETRSSISAASSRNDNWQKEWREKVTKYKGEKPIAARRSRHSLGRREARQWLGAY